MKGNTFSFILSLSLWGLRQTGHSYSLLLWTAALQELLATVIRLLQAELGPDSWFLLATSIKNFNTKPASPGTGGMGWCCPSTGPPGLAWCSCASPLGEEITATCGGPFGHSKGASRGHAAMERRSGSPQLTSQPSFSTGLQWELSTRWQCNTTHPAISAGTWCLVGVSLIPRVVPLALCTRCGHEGKPSSDGGEYSGLSVTVLCHVFRDREPSPALWLWRYLLAMGKDKAWAYGVTSLGELRSCSLGKMADFWETKSGISVLLNCT